MLKAVATERIGTALRAMAEDLVIERRRVLALRLENRQLRAQLEAAGLAAKVPPPNGRSKDALGDQRHCPYCRRQLPGAER